MVRHASEVLVCRPKSLPKDRWIEAAQRAVEINPVNHAPVERLARTMRGFRPTPARIAVVTTKYWRTNGVKLSVGFLDGESPELRRRIIAHMNAWAKSCNVQFVLGGKRSDVRIARLGGRDGGYWSYVGTDIQTISGDEPTMNLEGFTMNTSESEFRRVVRHETGHTLGCPHEHMRRTLVKKIDPNKAIEYFRRTDGWSARETRQQVLTPIEEGSLIGTPNPDPYSIMCYQVPGSITKDGKPIVGGADIDALDYTFMGTIYPKPGKPKSPPRRRKAASRRARRK